MSIEFLFEKLFFTKMPLVKIKTYLTEATEIPITPKTVKILKEAETSEIIKRVGKLETEKIEKTEKTEKIIEVISENIFPSHIVKVACVQREIRLVSKIEEYIDMVHNFVKQAAQEKCSLIIFPEYNFFDLFGLIPGFKLLNTIINKKTKNTLDKAKYEQHCNRSKFNKSNKSNNNNFLGKIFRGIAVPIETGVKSIMSFLSEKYGIYIYTGSYILKEEQDIYNAGFLFDPDGNCLGTQRKTHIVEFEKQTGFKRDVKLEVFPFNPEGYSFSDLKIAIPVCMDATYFETFAIARKMGADIVAIPIANMEEYGLWRALRGIWPRVQESYVYGIKASLNGWIAGMHFTGKAGIFAPIGITSKKNGVIALAPHHEGNYLVTACLDLQKLYEKRSGAEYYGDRNYEFEYGL